MPCMLHHIELVSGVVWRTLPATQPPAPELHGHGPVDGKVGQPSNAKAANGKSYVRPVILITRMPKRVTVIYLMQGDKAIRDAPCKSASHPAVHLSCHIAWCLIGLAESYYEQLYLQKQTQSFFLVCPCHLQVHGRINRIGTLWEVSTIIRLCCNAGLLISDDMPMMIRIWICLVLG